MALRRIISLTLLCAILYGISGCQKLSATPNAPRPKIALTDCLLSLPGTSVQVPAQCGRYDVPENRSEENSQLISLNLAVIPAVSRNPASDPVFYLAGGPGEAATQAFLLVYTSLSQVNQDRDIVLVDQRGTGGSNPLNCPHENLGEELELATYINNCLAGLEADPAMYTTSIAMDDLDEIRSALGYSQVNLYGTSYGTRAALEYARRYPDHVRTMILDGVVPLDWTLGPTVARDAQESLDKLFTRCHQDESCSTAFPDIENEFTAVINRLSEGPVRVSMMHPSTGELVEFDYNLEDFTTTIHMMSYTAESMSLVPILVHKSFDEGDFTAIAAQTLTTNDQLASLLSAGMRFTVICSEDQPFYSRLESSQGYLGTQYEELFNEACGLWHVEPVASTFKEALVSDIPALLLSGELDPVTPPANGEQVAKTLKNSLHIIVPLQGHGNLFRGCLPDIARDFIEDASVESLDASCVQKIQPAPFFINMNGPD